MSKNKLLIVILMLTLMLTGCFPSGELETSSEHNANNSNDVSASGSDNSGAASSATSNDLEYAKFNIDRGTDDYPTEMPVIKAKCADFDAEEMKALFLDGKEIVKEDIYDDISNFFTSDGACLCVRNDGIIFTPDDHSYDGETEKRDIYLMQKIVASYATRYYKSFPNIESELPGFPRSEAVERANELVEKVGVKYLGEPRVYTFTADDVHNFDERNELSEENEIYLVRYLTEYNGIPVCMDQEDVYGASYDWGSYVDVILSKDKKLVEFVCDHVFEDIEVTNTTQIKCGRDDALSRLYDYYRSSEVPTAYRLEYDELGLKYASYESNYETLEFTYKPLWCATGTIYVINVPNSTAGNKTNKFVDPVTGYVFDAGF